MSTAAMAVPFLERPDAKYQSAPEAQVRARYIVSIYPLPLPVKLLQRWVGFEPFKLVPPKDRNSYTILEVRNTYNWIPDPSGSTETDPTAKLREVPVPESIRADSLVNYWRNISLVSAYGGQIGIAVLPLNMKFPGEDEFLEETQFEPFRAFLKELAASQQQCFRGLMQQANDYASKGRAGEIQPYHFAAAEWVMGGQANSIVWYKTRNQEVLKLKKCVGCQKDIDAAALRCEHCSLDIIGWYQQYGIEPDDDVAVAVMLEKIIAKTVNAPKTRVQELPVPDFTEVRAPRTNLLDSEGKPNLSKFTKLEKDWAMKQSTRLGGTLYKYLKELADNELNNVVEPVAAAAPEPTE